MLLSIVFLVLLLLYLPNFAEPYFCLDDSSLLGIPQLSGHAPIWAKIKTIFTPGYHVDYYPVRDLSYLLDWSWGKDLEVNLLFAKLQNYFWFCFCGFLIYKILRKLNIQNVIAVILSSIWILHPANIELFLWVTARKDLLSIAFTLIAGYLLLLLEEGCAGFVVFLIPMFSLLAGLSKAGLLLMAPAAFLFIRFSKIRPKNPLTSHSLIAVSVLNLTLLFFHKNYYSAVNNMRFYYDFAFQAKGVITALGKMAAGMVYFPAVIIDSENWGQWGFNNEIYFYLGIVFIMCALLLSFTFRKDKKILFIITLIISVYLLIPGVNFFHRLFFSNRYWSPIFILILLGAGLSLKNHFEYLRSKRKILIILGFLYFFAVVSESENWESNLSIWNKSAVRTHNQPNILLNRLLTMLHYKKLNRLSLNELETMRSDASELLKICSAESLVQNQNGSLCLPFWKLARQIDQRIPAEWDHASKKELHQMTMSYINEINKLQKLKLSPEAEKPTLFKDTLTYQYYRAYLDSGRYMVLPNLRVYHIIDQCLYGNAENAHNIFLTMKAHGLLEDNLVQQEVASMIDENERSKVLNCFFNDKE